MTKIHAMRSQYWMSLELVIMGNWRRHIGVVPRSDGQCGTVSKSTDARRNANTIFTNDAMT